MSVIKSDNLKIGPCSLHVLTAGRSGDRDIVLLHGLKFSARTWRETGTLDILADNSCHAVALDMPGFGESKACSETQAQILAGIIAMETAGKPVLLGPSMGGRIALEFTLDHPGKIGALILVGAVGVEENRSRLAEIKVPTLIIWGSEDQVAPLENSDLLLNEIAESTRVVIDGAPHPCYLDQPKSFHRVILDFLSSLP